MKADKSQKEAVLRAHQSQEDNQQDQEKLYRPEAKTINSRNQAETMNESHHNRMKAWHNLRKMDTDLAKKQKNKE